MERIVKLESLLRGFPASNDTREGRMVYHSSASSTGRDAQETLLPGAGGAARFDHRSTAI